MKLDLQLFAVPARRTSKTAKRAKKCVEQNIYKL